MHFTLTTYYRVDFLPLVTSFVTETARCLGASQKEMYELGMASEEAGRHIIDHYPGNGLAEQFEVICEPVADGLRVVLSNMGLPVNQEELPRYEAAQPEETIEGLGLFLIEKMMDHFEFVNQGRAGWRTVMFKRLAHLTPPPLPAEGETAGPALPREKLRIMRAGLEHVPGIVELAYRNYGYSYSKEVFYYVEQLREAITDGRVKSYIAVNPDEHVVGQMALLQSPVSRDVAEAGAMMVQPEYRRSMGLLQLIKFVNQELKDPRGAPAVVEANLVTTHILSQKICSMFHFTPLALKLSVHDRARFVKLAEEEDGQRETLLHAIAVTRPVEPIRLYVPATHAEITRRLFSQAGLAPEFPAGRPALPDQTVLTTETNQEAGSATIFLREPGADFAALLRAHLFALESAGVKTVFIRFPGWLPQPDTLENETRALRIFFSGWVVEAPDRWWLQYTRLIAQRFDFKRIQLCDPLALELRDYVETCFVKAVL